ncbi:MAG: Holliday junction branch migration protein RuvA [Chitinophagaceae bacterium]|nr:Holliday junction branch migration protein RuvA [Chitinophagaceae bacterium]
MFAYLKGTFTLKTPTVVHVDVHGVGYEVQVSLNTYGKIQHLQEGTLFTHLLVREDAHILYGFFEKVEKEVFLQLLSVSGVGASTARMMLSSLQSEEVVRAILSGNEGLLESVKGKGKKTAQRIVLELRDKISKTTADGNISTLTHNTLEQDALTAMTALGIARNAAESAIKKARQTNTAFDQVQELIKAALKCL